MTSLLAFVVLCASVALGTEDPHKEQNSELLAPELELSRVSTELESILLGISASNSMIMATSGAARQQVAGDLFKTGSINFRDKIWLSVIRDLSGFLQSSQIIMSVDAFESNYMLGVSYEEVGLSSAALRHYRRALVDASSIEKPNATHLVDTVVRYSSIMIQFPSSHDETLSSALSSFVSAICGTAGRAS